MSDLIRESAQRSQVIIHEEIARDGAQGKTLLNGDQRVQIARRQSALFGTAAMHHLVFNAGFPSAGKEEFRATRQVAEEVEECYIGAAGRAIREDIDLLLSAVDGAKFPRIFIAVPASDRMAQTMMHCDGAQAAKSAVDMVRYAKDKRPELCVDVALADACRSDPGRVADTAVALTGAGMSMAIVCDTVGSLYPSESRTYYRDLVGSVGSEVGFVAHMHNDLGFGLVNTLEALSAGVYGLTSSWLSLGERAGMAATEQLLFILGFQPEAFAKRFGVRAPLWRQEINLKMLPSLARYVSDVSGRPLGATDPIVGTGVNSISTGTPFTNPDLFQPFNPQTVLGIPPQVHLTALASTRVVAAVAKELGFSLSNDEISSSLNWVKAEAFSRGSGVLGKEDFQAYLHEQGFGRGSDQNDLKERKVLFA